MMFKFPQVHQSLCRGLGGLKASCTPNLKRDGDQLLQV